MDIKKIINPPEVSQIDIPERQIEEQGVFKGWEFTTDNSTFDFKGGRILLNKQDLSKFISENISHLGASYWAQTARKLENYRQWAMRHVSDPEQLAVFAALVQAFLAKIGGRLKRKFDETIDGLSFHFEDDQLLLNGINVNAFIEMSRRNPSPKAKIFLKGLKNRMGIMLSNRLSNMNYEKMRGVVEELYNQIDEELSKGMEEVIYLPPSKES